MPETVTFSSPAKVNYYFKIVRRLESGYHEIVNVMSKISLYDEITLEIGGGKIEVSVDDSSVPLGAENTVFRAIELLLDRCGRKIGVKAQVKKVIPTQSGLGGGSSNAASVMLKLNDLLSLGLSTDELISLAIRVGSDVPFFIFGSPAIARGLGDILERIDGIPEAWIVIVKPQGGISTADAYKSIDLGLTVCEKNTIIPTFDGTLEGLAKEMWNDFEPLVEMRLPDIAKIKDGLLRHGSLRVMLSGSGSSVFGIFKDQVKAYEAYSELCSNPGWAVFLARNIFD